MNKKIIMPIALLTLLSLAVFVSAQCEDSDGGKAYYMAGEAIGKDSNNPSDTNYKQVDSCNFGQYEGTISEAYCDSEGFVFYDTHECPSGCENGACIKGEPFVCLDSDNGKNYDEKGTATGYEGDNLVTSTDACSGTSVVEIYCEGRDLKVEKHSCPNGCENAVCLPCQGCEVGDTCYQIGDRDQNSFCSENKDFTYQKNDGESCVSNYECQSESCSDGNCQGFFGKYLLFIILGIVFVVLLIIIIFLVARKKNNSQTNFQ